MSHTATMRDGSEKEYLTCAETAKLVRAALKQAFPGVKFSVRSDTYSGGASMRVRYVDGPTAREVEAVTAPYRGADFDGMVDLKTYNTSWLTPDGAAALARGGAQGSTLPEVLGDPPGPSARQVHFGADFIFVERDFSPEVEEEAKRQIAEAAGRPYEPNERYEVAVIDGRPVACRGAEEFGSDLFYRVVGATAIARKP